MHAAILAPLVFMLMWSLLNQTLIKFRGVCLFISYPSVDYWLRTNFSAIRIFDKLWMDTQKVSSEWRRHGGGHCDVAFDM